jgi:hypothetical protein
LIELLVCLAVLAVLMVILLPALGSARDSARGLECKSQLRTLYVAWDMGMATTDGLIPETFGGNYPHRWYDVLGKGLEDSGIDIEGASSRLLSCPEVQSQYGVVQYGQHLGIGYGVNVRWALDDQPGTAQNAGKPWASIPVPSRYPWLGDIEINTLNQNAYGFVAIGFRPGTTGAWGLGWHHRGQASVLYAAGNIGSVDESATQISTASESVPRFFAAER